TFDFATLGVSMPGALQRFHCGFTVQSQWKPYCDNGSSAKLPPMERSGTTMIAFRTFWLCSLSSAMNISARDLPDAGGDLIRRYCSPRIAYARSCMVRMPSSLDLVDAPVWAVRRETDGIVFTDMPSNPVRLKEFCCPSRKARPMVAAPLGPGGRLGNLPAFFHS